MRSGISGFGRLYFRWRRRWLRRHGGRRLADLAHLHGDGDSGEAPPLQIKGGYIGRNVQVGLDFLISGQVTCRYILLWHRKKMIQALGPPGVLDLVWPDRDALEHIRRLRLVNNGWANRDDLSGGLLDQGNGDVHLLRLDLHP